MTSCFCLSLWEELNWKMKVFEEKYPSAINDDQSLAGQHNLLKRQQNLATELGEIEIILDVLSLCPTFASKPRSRPEFQKTEIPEYLIGPVGERAIYDWMREEMYSESMDGACIAEMTLPKPNSSVPYEESVCTKESQVTGRWVLVYGFTPKLLPLVVAMFSQMGKLSTCETPSSGDWVAFHYAQPRDAERALRHNETVVGGQVIGVTNNDDFIRDVLYRQRWIPQTPPVSRTIRALRKPKIETRSPNCLAPKPLRGWRKVVYNILEILNV